MTNKKITELVQATQVNDADELVVVQSSQTKRVTKQVLQESLSVESGTTVNYDKLGSMDITSVSDFTSGNSSVIGASGLLQGTLGFEIANPIRGKQSLRYVNNATASNSNNDWVLRTVDVPLGYRGRIHEFNFQFLNSYTSGNIRIVLLVSSLAEPVIDTVLSNTELTEEFSTLFKMPEASETAQWGFQILNGESGADLIIDDVQVTPNIRTISESIITTKSASNVEVLNANGTGATNTAIRRFGSLVNKIGSAITYQDSPTLGSSFTVEEDGIYTVTYNDTGNTSSTETYVAISKNSSSLSTSPESIPTTEILAMEREYDGVSATAHFSLAWTGYLIKGDILRPHIGNGVGGGNTTRFSISKESTVAVFPPLKDQKVEIPASILEMRGVTTRGTGGESTTTLFNVFENLSGDAITYSNANGTIITVKKDGFLSVSASSYTVGTLYITRNAANPSTEPAASEMLASHSPGTGSARQNLAWSGTVNVGDLIRIANNSAPSADDASVLRVVHLETEVSVSINNAVPQYEESDSMIRLNTTNGRGAVNTAIRRFSNIIEQSGKSVVYADSANDGASFTIQEDGIYSISYTDLFGTSARLGISVNSNQLTSDISNVNNSNVLASTLTGSGNWTENVSWTGKLSASDVIRPHCNVAADNTSNLEGHFTIAKQSKPSIIGIDGRPLDAYQQKSDSYIRLYPMTGSDQFVNWGGVQDIKGSAISFQNSNEIVINEDGIYHFSGTVYMAGGSTPNIAFLKNTTVFTDSAVTPNMLYLSTHSDTTAQYDLVAFTAKLEAGDIVRGIGSTSIVPVGVNTFFTVSKIGSLTRSIPLIDSTVEIPTSAISLKGVTGLGSGSESQVIQYNNINKISGDGLTLDNSNGTKVVVQRRGVVSILGDAIMGSNGTIRITVNNPDRTNANPTGNYVISQSSESAGFHNQVSAVLKVEAGDEIHIIANNGVTVEASNNLTVLHQETEVAVALSNVTPQFEDVDSMIRLSNSGSGTGGFGSTNTAIRRYRNIETVKGSSIDYIDSATDGASFVIKENGVYSMSAVYAADNANAVFGFSKNSTQLTTGIISINPENRLAHASVPGVGVDSNISWTGHLEEGDIIRVHGVLSDSITIRNDRHHFTIAKQALPSIAEVNITSFADFNTNEWKTNSVIAYGNNGEVVGAGATTPFSNAQGDGWSSNEYTVQQNNSIIELSFGTLFTGSFGRSYDLYLNGSTYKRINQLVTNDQHAGSYISSRGEFDAGDVLTIRLAQGSGTLSNNPAYHYLVINEHYVEEIYERVYAVEDNENVFSARIKNNDSPADTASIISQSSEFIQSVNRSGEGIVDVTFVPGFFTEIPSVNATIEGTIDNTDVSESVRNLSVNGFRFITEYNPTGVGIDFSFSFTVQRQGSDYKDLQRQIVSLKGFPRVNNQLAQEIFVSEATSSMLSRSDELRFNSSAISFNGSSILLTEDDSVNSRTKFVAQKDCVVHVSISGKLDTAGFGLQITKNGVIIVRGNSADATNQNVDVTGSLRLYKDDYITVATGNVESEPPAFGGNLVNDTYQTRVHILAQSQELKSVGNLAGGENTFAARIANNGTATITSQSVDFIQSVTNASLGNVDVVFTPGFFAEPPVIVMSPERAGEAMSQVKNVSASGCTLETRDSNGNQINSDSLIQVQRQGSDYRDAQEQIIQLEDFPRVNRTLSQNVIYTGFCSTMLDLSGELRYDPALLNSVGDQVIIVEDDVANTRTKFVASRRCNVFLTASKSMSGASILRIYRNGSEFALGSDAYTNSAFSNVSVNLILEAGEYLTVHGVILGAAAPATLNIVATAQELERVDNVDAVENIFSASVDDAGNLLSESSPFISSITKGGAGAYTINFIPDFFSEAPVLVASSGNNNDYYSISVHSVSTTSANVWSWVASPLTPADKPFKIIVQRQGTDYKSIQDIVVALPESKIKWQKKTLGSATSANGVISDFTFNNLVIGNQYRLNGSVKISATEFSSNAKRYSATIDNGATNLVDIEVASSNVFEYKNTVGIGEVFIATATTVTLTCSVADLTQLSGGAHLILEELPLHEQTSEWT